jgi:hypothetical protein
MAAGPRMVCPSCGETYPWYETTCPACQVELVEEPPHAGGPPNPNAELVAVFQTSDEALIPLARMALDEQHIEHLVRESGPNQWVRPMMGDAHQNTSTTEIVVNAADAARAHELLDDLAHSTPAASAPVPPAAEPARSAPPRDPRVIQLHGADTGGRVGEITETQLQFLIDQLEEDPGDPESYYIDGPTIELLKSAGADEGLVSLLERAINQRDGLSIRWSGTGRT